MRRRRQTRLRHPPKPTHIRIRQPRINRITRRHRSRRRLKIHLHRRHRRRHRQRTTTQHQQHNHRQDEKSSGSQADQESQYQLKSQLAEAKITAKSAAEQIEAAARGEIDEIPDILLLLTEELAVVDNLSGKISLIVYADPTQANAYEAGRARLQTLRRRLREPVDIPLEPGSLFTQAESEIGADAFKAAVLRAKWFANVQSPPPTRLSRR